MFVWTRLLTPFFMLHTACLVLSQHSSVDRLYDNLVETCNLNSLIALLVSYLLILRKLIQLSDSVLTQLQTECFSPSVRISVPLPQNEIKSILDLGVSPDRIIYANPFKQVSHLKYAAEKGVNLMTFDSEIELHKFKTHHPTAKLVLCIKLLKSNSHSKFGCNLSTGKELLDIAKKLHLNIIGVCFHVGGGKDFMGCNSPSIYQSALTLSEPFFQYGAQIGYDFTFFDIGGSFPGDRKSEETFKKVAAGINDGLVDITSKYPHVKTIIAEPGRYFAQSTHTLAVSIISKNRAEDGSLMYITNDGLYGSFSMNAHYPQHPLFPKLLKEEHKEVQPVSLWGPVCAADQIGSNIIMPELNIGDWIYYEDMGSYTVSLFSSFNGFSKPIRYYYIKENHREAYLGCLNACDSVDKISIQSKEEKDDGDNRPNLLNT